MAAAELGTEDILDGNPVEDGIMRIVVDDVLDDDDDVVFVTIERKRTSSTAELEDFLRDHRGGSAPGRLKAIGRAQEKSHWWHDHMHIDAYYPRHRWID